VEEEIQAILIPAADSGYGRINKGGEWNRLLLPSSHLKSIPTSSTQIANRECKDGVRKIAEYKCKLVCVCGGGGGSCAERRKLLGRLVGEDLR
jgi:hypothetical protein